MEKDLTITEVAKQLQITRQAVYVAIMKHKMVAYKSGAKWMIKPECLKQYRENRFSRTMSLRDDGTFVYRPEMNEFSPSQVADKLKVPVNRIYHLIRMNRLKHYRHRSAYVVEVKDWEETQKIVFDQDLRIPT